MISSEDDPTGESVRDLSPPRDAPRSDVAQVFGPPPDELASRRKRLDAGEAGPPGRPEHVGEVRPPVHSAPPRVRNRSSESWTVPPPATLPPMASFDAIGPGESSEFTLDGGELWLYVRDARHKLLGGMTATDIGERLGDGRLDGKEMVSLDRVNWIGVRYLDRLSVVLAGGRAAGEAGDMPPPPPSVAPPLGIEEETWDRRIAPPPAVEPTEAPVLEAREPVAGQGAPLADPGTLDIQPPKRRSWAPMIVLALLGVAVSIGWMLDRRTPELTVQVAPSAVSATDEAPEPVTAAKPAAGAETSSGPAHPARPVAAAASAEAAAAAAAAAASDASAPERVAADEPVEDQGGSSDNGTVDPPPAQASAGAAADLAARAAATPSESPAREATQRRPQRGKVRVESDRPLRVQVAGRDRGGMAPTRLTLPAGAHRISLLDPASGQVVLDRRVRVRPGRTVTVDAPPAAMARAETPTTAGPKADAAEDARAEADGPAAPADVAAGSASPEDAASPSAAPAPVEPEAVAAPGAVAASARGVPAAVEAPAAPAQGYISVTAREPLMVIIDGASTGKRTPLWMHAVPSGRRVIELRAADGRVVHRRVAEVPSNQTVPVLFQK